MGGWVQKVSGPFQCWLFVLTTFGWAAGWRKRCPVMFLPGTDSNSSYYCKEVGGSHSPWSPSEQGDAVHSVWLVWCSWFCIETILQAAKWTHSGWKLLAVGHVSDHSSLLSKASFARFASRARGMRCMKSVACSCVWWPNLDSQIEVLVKSCIAPAVTPLHPWIWPAEPWHRIDYAGPFKGKMFLVMVDAHSKVDRSMWSI